MEEVGDQHSLDNTDNDLQIKVTQLENDNRRLRGEFDSQRAKLKDLFLQKEVELKRKNDDNLKLLDEVQKLNRELHEIKSQLALAHLQLESNEENIKAQNEIKSLQLLVHETVEESSTCKSIYDMELKKLYGIIQQYENEIRELKAEHQSPHHTVHQEQSSMAPSVMLSAVTKTLVRKLGAEAFTSQDNLEDSMRKVDDDDHAQEDVEVLRSLVVPLEEEIRALKDKLRSTDEQLQKCQQCKHFQQEVQSKDPFSNNFNQSSFDSSKYAKDLHSPVIPCDMCSNYEAQLVKEQKKSEDLHLKVLAAEKATDRHKEELLKEIGFRKEIEEKWNEKKEEHKLQVAELTTRTDCAEQDLKELQQVFKQTCGEVNQHLLHLTDEREKVHQELDKLQRENENLVGKYSIHSQQLQSEIINLPDTVEELQETILKMHQELIIAKIGKESAEEQANDLRSNIVLLQDKFINEQHLRQEIEISLNTESNNLKSVTHHFDVEKKSHLVTIEKLAESERNHKENLIRIEELQITKKQLDDKISELRSRVGSLQQELDNSEAVQKDFVKLSQSLQVQLEKIRDSDAQVRWQHEEDTDDCPTCRNSFSVTKRKKYNCRHCGQIFCVSCLSHSVPSGPNQRPSRVCDVCHTLLVKSSAPYFSTEVPHSPD